MSQVRAATGQVPWSTRAGAGTDFRLGPACRAPAYPEAVDTDAVIAVNQPSWDRLEALVRTRSLDGEQIDELIGLYQRTATDLSTVRSTNPDPVLTARLSMLLSRARSRITGARTPLWSHARAFVLEDFPAALWASRRGVLVAAAVLVAATLGSALAFGLDDSLRASIVPEPEQRRLATREFTAYYFQGQAGGFAANVWTNNAWITVQAVVFGVTGVWPLWMLVQNGLNLGLTGAVMGEYDRLGTFFVHLLPHGLLELTCVVIGAGAGLRLFWSWLRPGPLPRLWALARAGRSLVTVAIGLVPVLLVSGILEAFVTPSPLPAALRVAIGTGVWVVFLVYVVVLGRRAASRGITGDLSEEVIGDSVAVAA